MAAMAEPVLPKVPKTCGVRACSGHVELKTVNGVDQLA